MIAVRALLRFLAYHLLAPIRTDGLYSPGSDVGVYKGWSEIPYFGPIAFRDFDDSLQFRW